MSAHQPRTQPTPLDALLGESRLRRTEQAALAELLSPITAPARAGELRGEPAALAAFRTVFPPATTAGVRTKRHGARRRSPLTARLARALSIKAAVATLTVAGMGGVAVAASTGALPGPIDRPWHKPAQVQPEQPGQPAQPVQPVQPVTPEPTSGGATAPAGGRGVVPPGAAVAGSTHGAAQRERVQERNAQRQQEQREQLAAERDTREARLAERRARQAEKRQELTERQAGLPDQRSERAAEPQVGVPAVPQQEPRPGKALGAGTN